jgi:hypothetical protein
MPIKYAKVVPIGVLATLSDLLVDAERILALVTIASIYRATDHRECSTH